MIIGTVSRLGMTLIFQELKASNLVNDLTISEFCDCITNKLSRDIIDTDLKIAIIDTERKNIFYFNIDNILFSITLEQDKE